MSELSALPESRDESGVYEIRLKGHIAHRWAVRFEDAMIALEEDGNTLLICPAVDQAALYGLLKRIRDLGIPLLSVNPGNPGRARTQEGKS
jgi:hypothetical protein